MTRRRSRKSGRFLLLIPHQGREVPSVALEPFRASGFKSTAATWKSLESKPLPADHTALVWVADDWEGAFRRLEAVPEERRASVVFLGATPQARRLAREMVRLGGLAVVTLPVPEWFPELLAATTPRLAQSSQRQLAALIADLEGAIEDSPEGLLERAAAAAGRLLHADLTVPVLQVGERRTFRALVRKEKGEVRLENWNDDPERRLAPSGLAGTVLERLELLILPKVSHWNRFRLPQVEGRYEAALIQPIRVPSDGRSESRRPLLACLNFYWKLPHLPTPNELAAFAAITAIARSAVSRLAEQTRMALIQEVTRRAVFRFTAARPPVGVPGAAEATSSTKAPHPALVIRELLHSYATWSGLEGLWARCQTVWDTPIQTEWFTGSADLDAGPPEKTLQTLERRSGIPVRLRTNRWGIRLPAKETAPHRVVLIAVFTSESAARGAFQDLLRLASDLLSFLLLERQSADAAAVASFSTAPAAADEARDELLQILQLVQGRTGSDGAKIFVHRREGEARAIRQLCNTEVGATAPKPVEFDEKRGLADWVIGNSDWLLLSERALGHRPGIDLERAVTGRHGEVQVLARLEEDYYPDKNYSNDESGMLFVPVVTHGETTGALAVWRREGEPYDSVTDPNQLLYFVPQVAAACTRMLQLQKAGEELEAISGLTRDLDNTRKLSSAYRKVAKGTAQVAGAAVAILLVHDEYEDSYFLASVWSREKARIEQVRDDVGRFCSEAEGEFWSVRLKKRLGDLLPGLRLRTLFGVKVTTETAPPLVVALFDQVIDGSPPLFLSQELHDHFAQSFLEAAWVSLQVFARSLGSRLIDDIGSNETAGDEAAEQVLSQVGELLGSASGAEAVMIYTGTPNRMVLKSAWPAWHAPETLPQEAAVHTRLCISSQKALRALDATALGSPLDQNAAKALASALGWAHLGSWLCCPVMHRGRALGLVKLLTGPSGPFLGADHERLVKLVAERSATEMVKAASRLQVRELLDLTRELTSFHGAELSEQLLQRLESWLRRTLLRPDCHLGVVAFVEKSQQPLLAVASAGIVGRLEELRSLAANPGARSLKLTAKDLSPPVEGMKLLLNPQGVMVNLTLPGDGRLQGGLFVFHPEEFYSDDLETLQRVAHYVALVLNSERERRGWRNVMGRFRHQLIGPVQGLSSAAKLLAKRAEAVVSLSQVQLLKARIYKETEIIRLWRENQRFYMNDRVELRKTRFSLRSLIERCVDRYSEAARERGIEIRVEMPPRGDIQILADEGALDLAVSNLLENACKYSYRNRFVTVGCAVDKQVLTLWVEDEGHPIPPAILAGIEYGKRGAHRDPFRLIEGSGVGLAMVIEVARAHDAEFKSSSAIQFKHSEDGKDVHCVRFLLEFPYAVSR